MAKFCDLFGALRVLETLASKLLVDKNLTKDATAITHGDSSDISSLFLDQVRYRQHERMEMICGSLHTVRSERLISGRTEPQPNP